MGEDSQPAARCESDRPPQPVCFMSLPVTPLPPQIAQALQRLHQALGQIEAAAERAGEFAQLRANLQEEAAIMQDDRARLAAELDSAQAHARALELASADVSRRLDAIGGAIAHAIADVAALAGDSPSASGAGPRAGD